MSKAEKYIQARVEEFAEELSELIRNAALEAVLESLQGTGTPTAGRPKEGVRRRVAANTTKRVMDTGGRGRRSADELAALQNQIVGYLRDNPGQRVEEIASGIEVPSRDLKRPIAKLLEDGALRKKGEKRATRYTVR
ncbi:MAG: hypothetical protein AAF355_11850 [Myxococcota bacterium]